ncbi:site-specific DNA-methyltransferase [Bartonella apis]|uniref:site-specific DNA-methyltransferase n=1 Tax=Bartonella apis TaxID=1686310 RepID=UPI00242AACAB|nr:site-specific DNA-methyltransferase [Bartonella apis]
MDKMEMHSPDLSQQNVEKLKELFPDCVTESRDENGKPISSIDFDLLKQELSGHVLEDPQERYQIDWPGKHKAMFIANAPIAKTLRPAREESVDFDNTKNLFIEGDNLAALKLLQETYLNKVKMIYIDPPYNTGKDFIFNDDYAEDLESYLERSNQVDDEGNRLVANTETNGRFHSDWLSMMYSRLKLARNLLRDDGVIFISIDDNEQANLKRLCDEVFGEKNFRNQIIIRRRTKTLNMQFAEDGLYSMNVGCEFILIYSKTNTFLMNPLQVPKKKSPKKGTWNVFWSGADRPTMRYELFGFTPASGQWRWCKNKAEAAILNYKEYVKDFASTVTLEEYWEITGRDKKFIRRIEDGTGKNGGVQYWVPPSTTYLRNSNWSDIEVSQIHKEFELSFDNPKNTTLIKLLVKLGSCDIRDFRVLDFFAGSGTTAHAVMQLNAEDGGKRQCISVQLPVLIKEDSDAYKAGYKNVAELSKERIRRAGKKIKEENPDADVDIGFRVLKVDTSNMEDVYYFPDEVEQADLLAKVNNIKPDRTAEDLLFQVLLDWGVDLTLPIEKREISGKTVYFVDENALVACFDEGIDETFINEVAEIKPLRVVFRDSGFASDAVKINVTQIFKLISPDTDIRTI